MSAVGNGVAIERVRFQVATALLLPLIVLGLGAPQVPPARERPLNGDCALCGGSGEIECPHCHGDWRHAEQTVPCTREGNAGCNESGAVKCYRCRGRGEVKCSKCRGRGYWIRRSSGGSTVMKNRRMTCQACRGTGKVDCEHCAPGSQCPKCKRYFTYSQLVPKYCKWCYPDAQKLRQQGKPGGTPLERVTGVRVCPRCEGAGKYTKEGKCPECNKGKVPCPMCAKPKEP